MRNTKLNIQYRSGNNDKSSCDVVIQGQFTVSQFNRLIELGTEFVPAELGIENPAMNFAGLDGFPVDGVDHGFCTLEYNADSYDDFIRESKTSKPPTISLSVDAFLDGFENAPCDATAEFQRMALAV